MARKVFEDSVVPLPPDDGLVAGGLVVQAAAPRNRAETMEVMFSLALPADSQRSLEEAVARGDVVPAGELAAIRAADGERAKLETWLEGHGFSVEHVSEDGTSVYTTSTVANLAKQLQVDMVQVTKDGITFTAARNAPSLPATVGEGVQAIIGLQPFRHANKHFRSVVPPIPAAEAARVLNSPPYLVSEILAAYGAGGLTVDGTGQTIAILIDTVPKDIGHHGLLESQRPEDQGVADQEDQRQRRGPGTARRRRDTRRRLVERHRARSQDPGLRQRIAVVRRSGPRARPDHRRPPAEPGPTATVHQPRPR